MSTVTITYAVTASGELSINGNDAKERGTVLEDGSVLSMIYFDPGDNYASLGVGIKQ